MTVSLITNLSFHSHMKAEALQYFRDMQRDVLSNESAIIYYNFFLDKFIPDTIWVVEIFENEEAKNVHLKRHEWRKPDFDRILSRPTVFNELIQL